MPIEIRELVIRAIVEPGSGAGAGAGGCGGDAGYGAAPDRQGNAALVQECVAEVMRQLRRAEEP